VLEAQIVRVAQLNLGDGTGGVLPQRVRMGRMREEHTKIESGAWHFSFFTDEHGVIEKARLSTCVPLAPMRDIMHAGSVLR
jgi:hypothetical protein